MENGNERNQGANQRANQRANQGNSNLPRTNAINDVEINRQAIANVNNALEKYNLIKKKDILYYILGPITYFDRELIKGLLKQNKNVKVFIQGGIETTNKDKSIVVPSWCSTSLAGIVPANAGMDYENFYGFFQEDNDENLSVYVQFTNMAKPGGSNTIIKQLWFDDMEKFIENDFRDKKILYKSKSDRSDMFGKFWQYYSDSTAGGPWQHDPIEVINSLFLLDEEDKSIKTGQSIKEGRTCTYNEENLDGRLTDVQPKPKNPKEIIAHLLDHKEKDEETYKEKQIERFGIFKRLFMKSMQGPSRVVRGPRLDPSRLVRFGQIDTQNESYKEIDALINRVMEYIQTTYHCIVSIEILDPDNSFAAELIKYISGNTADVYVHSQYYPEDITLKCKIENGKPSMVGFMDLPVKEEGLLNNLLNEGTSFNPELIKKSYEIVKKIEKEEIDMSEIEQKTEENELEEFFPLVQNFIFNPDKSHIERVKLLKTPDNYKLAMYSKFTKENKHPYMDCKLAEINFMKILLGYERVFEGQPLYGYRDSDFTFSARGLVHPCTQFNKEDFTNKSLDRKEFVNKTFLSLSNTMGRDRISILEAWKSFLGGRSKRRTKKQKRTKKHRRINHKSRKR